MLTLEHRMAAAICEIARGTWDGGFDELDIRTCLEKHGLIVDAEADEKVAAESWAQNYDIQVGDHYERLADDVMALDRAAADTALNSAT